MRYLLCENVMQYVICEQQAIADYFDFSPVTFYYLCF
jgi:hypothetical protein